MESSASVASWQVYPLRSKVERQTDEQWGIDPLFAQILVNRGILAREDMQRFLNASYDESLDPFLLTAMDHAVERIRHALTQKEHITVYGDYDADGVTSSALLYRALRVLKDADAPLDFFIPHRLTQGCGLNTEALDAL